MVHLNSFFHVIVNRYNSLYWFDGKTQHNSTYMQTELDGKITNMQTFHNGCFCPVLVFQNWDSARIDNWNISIENNGGNDLVLARFSKFINWNSEVFG